MMLLFSFLICMVFYSSSAEKSCPGIGKDVFEDLMDVMMTLKCQSGQSDNGEPQRKPAFLAALSKGVNLGANHVVKFDDIKTNIGDRYDASSGVFTVPRKGTYVFAVNFVTGSKNEWLELNLMKNNKMVVRGHAAFDMHTSGSLQAILELKKGDRIYIKHPRSSGLLLGGSYTMFSGHYI
ncbi:C1QL [Mytilus coruscus]|uniref:C1QL n=1 Tax=Mytilus coruscus TaxID=42192 RepID=A0A6J8DXT5_MYTCO|nr:C1QL [Mytilus coruscus]